MNTIEIVSLEIPKHCQNRLLPGNSQTLSKQVTRWKFPNTVKMGHSLEIPKHHSNSLIPGNSRTAQRARLMVSVSGPSGKDLR